MKPINWNNADSFSLMLWNQNLKQFWIDTEIPLSRDKISWENMTSTEKETYKRILAGLTLLDTSQGLVGMPRIMMECNNLFEKNILSFMGAMENIHAKSYSSIFSTLCSTSETNAVFDWAENEPILQEKMNIILDIYNNIPKYSLPVAMATSVFLESFLFYSGFYYPLLLAGKGTLTSSNEIINLIIRDESIHGVYVGQLFKNCEKTKENIDFIYKTFNELYTLEKEYAKMLYDKLGFTKDVTAFIEYNANKAFDNLGLEKVFTVKDTDFNPLVLRGLDTTSKQHEFFSNKGNSYAKATNVEELSDDDFNF